jgi:hypothetical protein
MHSPIIGAAMEKVKRMVEAGTSIPTAIKDALGMPVAMFARKHRLSRQAANSHINGTVRADELTIAALIEELGGQPDEWRELLWLAARPTKAHVA